MSKQRGLLTAFLRLLSPEHQKKKKKIASVTTSLFASSLTSSSLYHLPKSGTIYQMGRLRHQELPGFEGIARVHESSRVDLNLVHQKSEQWRHPAPPPGEYRLHSSTTIGSRRQPLQLL
jgi:hypothetical protein